MHLHRHRAGWIVIALWAAISPTAFSTTVLYALTRGSAGLGQIFKSTDSAKTWQLTAMTGVAFAVDPKNPNIVYSLVRTTTKMTTDSGGPAVLRSTDGGQTFTGSSFNGVGP